MNEINVLNINKEALTESYDCLVETAEAVSDIAEILENEDTPKGRIAVKQLNALTDELLATARCNLKRYVECDKDEKDTYLDNLKGYFNETTGTWYEQICDNFHKLTGFTMNKWDALTWTIHLSLGHSVRDYLVHTGRIERLGESLYKLPSDFSESTAVKFGANVKKIKELEKNNFAELA